MEPARMAPSVVGASVIGIRHKLDGTPAQDAWAKGVFPGGLIFCLADGAGSASLSHFGSGIAVRHASSVIRRALIGFEPTGAGWAQLFRHTYSCVRDRLRRYADRRGIAVQSLATTLMCVVITLDTLAVANLGDGFLTVKNRAGDLETLVNPQRGEFEGETYFVTMPESSEIVSITLRDATSISCLAASTDGLVRLATQLPSYTPYTRFFDPLFSFAERATHSITA